MTWPEAVVAAVAAGVGIPSLMLFMIAVAGGSMPWDRRK